MLCYPCLPRGAFVLPAMCDCGISGSYSLTFANRLENLVQLFNAESHSNGINPVPKIDDAIAKFVLTNVSKKMDMYISLIMLT